MANQTDKPIQKGAGRPCRFTPEEIKEKATHYLENFQDYGNKVPSIHGLARALKVDRSTIYDWIQKGNTELSYIVKDLAEVQALKLVDNGLDGTFNSAITKLMLSKHGYTESSGNSGTSVNVTVKRDSIQVETGGQVLEIDTDD